MTTNTLGRWNHWDEVTVSLPTFWFQINKMNKARIKKTDGWRWAWIVFETIFFLVFPPCCINLFDSFSWLSAVLCTRNFSSCTSVWILSTGCIIRTMDLNWFSMDHNCVTPHILLSSLYRVVDEILSVEKLDQSNGTL
jgi:hypothetical protein